MPVANVYPHYVTKAEKKGRTKDEVDEIIRWLTGYSQEELKKHLEDETDFESFFAEAPELNPARRQITGVILACGLKKSKSPSCKRSAIWTSSSMSWREARRWRKFCSSESCRTQVVVWARYKTYLMGTRIPD